MRRVAQNWVLVFDKELACLEVGTGSGCSGHNHFAISGTVVSLLLDMAVEAAADRMLGCTQSRSWRYLVEVYCTFELLFVHKQA